MKLARLLTIFLICPTAFAAPRTFVSALTGADTNPCSRSAPCRSFQTAVGATDVTGEVVALDTGGYGPMNLTYAISIIAPSGVQAGITGLTGNAITVSSGIGTVILKNLSINNVGADVGIYVTAVRQLHVEGCTISGFSEGILFNPTDSGFPPRLYVKNSEIRRSAIGIYILPSTAQAFLESVQLYGNDSGVEISSAEITIRKSVANGPGTYGFRAESNSKWTVEDTLASGNLIGFFANANAIVFLNRCQAIGNSTAGIKSQFGSSIFVSDSTITANATGVSAVSNGAVLTRCTDVIATPPCPAGHFSNTLIANTTNGAFSASYSSN